MTERDDSLHVVFGATGAIGGVVVIELVHAGRGVRAVSRGGQAPYGAQGVAADVSDPAQAARAAAGASVSITAQARRIPNGPSCSRR
jgi:uncharacterized protein YbjT (DUF2867 family)